MRKEEPPYAGEGLRHVVLDLETTGLSHRRGDRVIEVGAVAVECGGITEEFHSLIDAGRPISPYARRVHGISEAMLAGQPSPETVFPALKTFLRGSPLVCHNAPFDLGFLRAEFSRCGLALPNPFRCTLRLSRRRYPHLTDHRLETVARHLLGEIPTGFRLHRALADAGSRRRCGWR